MDVHSAERVTWGYLSSWLDLVSHHTSTFDPFINMLLLPLGLGVVVYAFMKYLFAYLARYHAA